MAGGSTRKLPKIGIDAVVGLLCLVVAIALTVVKMRHFGMDYNDQAMLALTVAITIVLPGALITRRFPARSLVSRYGIAFAAGLGAQLAGWAFGVKLHQGVLLWVLPPLLGAAWFLAEEGLRKVFSSRERANAQRTPYTWRRSSEYSSAPLLQTKLRHKPGQTPWWAAVSLLVSWWFILRSLTMSLWDITPLDRHVRWYQDLDWHVSITAAAMHHVMPTDPQSAADGYLSYHWFSNAHAAALTMASGVGLDKISVIGWYVPVMAATLALVYGMANYLSRTPAAGALAGLLLAVPPAFVLASPIAGSGTSALLWLSPSQVFCLPVGILLTWVVIAFLRQERTSWSLGVLMFCVALLAPGSKVSLLPTLLGGVGMVFLFALIRRTGWKRPLAVAIVGALIVLVTKPLFGGGGGGSVLMLGATADQRPGWRLVTHAGHPQDAAALTLLVLAMLGTFIPSLFSVALWHEKSDPAPRFYLGVMVLALAVMFTLHHPSLSQVYFVAGIAPLMAAFIAWGAIKIWYRTAVRWGVVTTAAAIGLAGVGAAVISQLWTHDDDYLSTRYTVKALTPFVVGLFAVAAVGWFFWRTRSRNSLMVGTVLAAAVLSFSSWPAASNLLSNKAPVPAETPKAKAEARKGASKPPRKPTSPLSWDEVQGAQALARMNPDGHRIATNVHCKTLRQTSHCDARAFWVTAISQSPAFIGGWGYSNSVRALNDRDGFIYLRQPYPNKTLYAANQNAFTQANDADLALLKSKGVRFLYADRGATPVSPELATKAKVVWNSPEVTVYELR